MYKRQRLTLSVANRSLERIEVRPQFRVADGAPNAGRDFGLYAGGFALQVTYSDAELERDATESWPVFSPRLGTLDDNRRALR